MEMMKNILKFILLCWVFALTSVINTGCSKDEPPVPEPPLADSWIDPAFANALQAKGYIRDAETATPNDVANIRTISVRQSRLTSLKGIEYFVNLENLNCEENLLENLDLSALSHLKVLDCNSNKLTTLSLEGLTELERLSCHINNLQELDLSPCPNLSELAADLNDLTSLDVSHHKALIRLSCSANPSLHTLLLPEDSNLQDLFCSDIAIPSLHIPRNTYLTYLNCGGKYLKELTGEGLIQVKALDIEGAAIRNAGLASFENLERLYCSKIQWYSLDLSGNPKLKILICSESNLKEVNISENLSLEEVNLSHNKLSEVDVASLPNLRDLDISYNKFNSLNLNNITNLQFLNCSNNQLESLELKNMTWLEELDCRNNLLKSLDISSCPFLRYVQLSGNPGVDREFILTINARSDLYVPTVNGGWMSNVGYVILRKVKP